ncbi:CAP domain-containing protein [candidate division FCPU426 bacterium]|nr:CAP domain-containing protein [candidate division FCPU426 bacterium]
MHKRTPTFSSRQQKQETGRLLVLMNKYRKQHGLGPLAIDASLQAAAQWMSADMAKNNNRGHTDSLGRDTFRRLRDFGYTANTYQAENVAAGYSTAAEVLAGWKTSPGHNANMLHAHFTVMGIGLTYHGNAKFGWYWATTFGGQQSSPRRK